MKLFKMSGNCYAAGFLCIYTIKHINGMDVLDGWMDG